MGYLIKKDFFKTELNKKEELYPQLSKDLKVFMSEIIKNQMNWVKEGEIENPQARVLTYVEKMNCEINKFCNSKDTKERVTAIFDYELYLHLFEYAYCKLINNNHSLNNNIESLKNIAKELKEIDTSWKEWSEMADETKEEKELRNKKEKDIKEKNKKISKKIQKIESKIKKAFKATDSLKSDEKK